MPEGDDNRAIYPSLRGKKVLVTGGGSGIGAEMVRGFALGRVPLLLARRFHIAGHDTVHADVVRPEVAGERARQAFDRRFARLVKHEVR